MMEVVGRADSGSFWGFCAFIISSASSTHSARFESLVKHSSSHCKELEAKSHNWMTASKLSPSVGIRKTGIEVVVVVVTVVETWVASAVEVPAEEFSIFGSWVVEAHAELVAKSRKIEKTRK